MRFRSRTDAEPADGLARELVTVGRYADAAGVAEIWATDHPDDFEAYAILAECRKLDGDVAAAQKVWLDVARRFPTRSESYSELADLLIERGEIDRAKKIVERGLELATDRGPIEDRLARIGLVEARRLRASQSPPVGSVGSAEPAAAAMAPPVADLPPIPRSQTPPLPAPVPPVAPPPAVASPAPRKPAATIVGTPVMAPPKPTLPSPVIPPRRPASTLIGSPTGPIPDVDEPFSTVPSPISSPLAGFGVGTPTPSPAPVSPTTAALPSGLPGAPQARSVPPQPAAKPLVTTVAPPPVSRPAPDEVEDDDNESTIVASRSQLDALRSLGAMLPSGPSDSEPPREELSGLGIIGSVAAKEISVVRERGDATIPYPTEGAEGESRRSSSPPAPVAGTKSVQPVPAAPTPLAAPATEPYEFSFPDTPADRPKVAPKPIAAPPPAPTRSSPGTVDAVRPASTPFESLAEPLPRPSTPDPAAGPTAAAPDVAATGTENREASADADVAAPGSPWKSLFAIVALVAIGAGLGFGYFRYDQKRTADALAARDALLVGADSVRVTAALRDRALTRKILRASHRDLVLEAMLLDAASVGGVGSDDLAGAILRGRARGLDATTIATARAARAYVDSGVDAADRLLPPNASSSPRSVRLAHAILATTVGRHADARRELDSLARTDPTSVGVALALADLDRVTGDPASARRRVDAVLRSHRDHVRALVMSASLSLEADAPVETRVRTSIDTARAPLGKGDLLEADAILVRIDADRGESALGPELIRALDGATRLAPSNEVDLAEALVAVGHADVALRRLVDSFGDAPTELRARHALARAHAALGDFDDVLRLVGDDPASLDLRAEAAVGNADLARSVVSEIAALGAAATPRLRAATFRLRVVAGEQVDTVLAEAEAALAAMPLDRELRVAVLELAADEGRWDRVASNVGDSVGDDLTLAAFRALASLRALAIDEFTTRAAEVARIAPESGDAIAFAAHGHLLRAELDEADADFTRLAASTSSLVAGTAHVVGTAGRLGVALERRDLDAARTIDAEFRPDEASRPDVVIVRARFAVADGRYRDAIAALETSASAPNARLDSVIVLADALLAANAIDRAGALYRQVLSSVPDQVDAQLGIAEILSRAQGQEANSQLIRVRRSLDAHPRGPAVEGRYAVALGRALLAKRDLEQARFVLRRGIQAGAIGPEAHFFLGESLAGTNSPDARDAYERYLALVPNGEFAERARRALR